MCVDHHSCPGKAEATRLAWIRPGLRGDWSSMPGYHFEDTADFIGVLVSYLETGRLAANKLYTSSLFVPQSRDFRARFQLRCKRPPPRKRSLVWNGTQRVDGCVLPRERVCRHGRGASVTGGS